jgi:hypothetical protein
MLGFELWRARGGFVRLQAMDEDYYADTRRMACHAVERLLAAAGARLALPQRKALYSELLKRLDDSSDAVRLGACAALLAFADGLQVPVCILQVPSVAAPRRVNSVEVEQESLV